MKLAYLQQQKKGGRLSSSSYFSSPMGRSAAGPCPPRASQSAFSWAAANGDRTSGRRFGFGRHLRVRSKQSVPAQSSEPTDDSAERPLAAPAPAPPAGPEIMRGNSQRAKSFNSQRAKNLRGDFRSTTSYGVGRKTNWSGRNPTITDTTTTDTTTTNDGNKRPLLEPQTTIIERREFSAFRGSSVAFASSPASTGTLAAAVAAASSWSS